LTIGPINTGALALVLAAWCPAGSLVAQVYAPTDTLRLTLAEAQRLSLERSPSFLADREERAIARGELRQARVFAPNPQIELETPGAATDGGFGQYEVALSQEIEWGGQRGLRIDAAESGVRRGEQLVRDAARLTVLEASQAYYAALAAGRRLRVAEEIFASNERLLAAVRTQVREGEISVLEGNLAEIEVARARARVLGARREATSAELALKRAIGIGPDATIRLAEELPEAPDPAALRRDSLVQRALERRPDLAARSAAVSELETTARLARREAIPNLEIRALGEREEAPGESRFGVGVGLPFPLWNRNQGTVARVSAEAQQATWSRTAAELRIRTEVADAYQAYLAASEEAGIYERDVLEPAQENQQLLETAYREGKIDLPALLLLRNQLLDAELSYWDAWLARRRSLVELEAATASIGSGLSEIDPDFEPE
jgi:cobalt-zinc-cadmium efflux system outer membrane protein